MPEKSVYSLTEAGEQQFEKLMFEVAAKPIHIFWDFNSVIVNLDSLPVEEQKSCLAEIEGNVKTLKMYLEENIRLKENLEEIPEMGMEVLKQQYVLVEAIEKWIDALQRKFER